MRPEDTTSQKHPGTGLEFMERTKYSYIGTDQFLIYLATVGKKEDR